MSYGMEDVDRYIVVYKKDYAPSEDEILARRNGEEWNAETAKKYQQMVIQNAHLLKWNLSFTKLAFIILLNTPAG